MRFLASILSLVLFTTALQGQVWPGDINSNGAVDNLDLLYLGYAFGTIGPARDTSSIEWANQNLPLEWEQKFPVSDSTNYAHADCNGDGIVSILDLLALNSNYFDTNGAVNPISIPQGIVGVDPAIDMDSTNLMGPILQGTVLSVPVMLGDLNIPISQINGLSFSVKYDPSVISSSSIHLFTGASWFNPSGSEILQLQKNDAAIGKLDIALSRFGVNSVSGDGQIGTLFFVIEGDVIDLIPEDSMYAEVMIEEITMIDHSFNKSPVVSDTLKLKIVSPEYFLVSNKNIIRDDRVRVFPNPTSGHLWIDSPHRILDQISLYDAYGRLLLYTEPQQQGRLQLSIGQFPIGFYLLKMQTADGILSRKVMIEKE